MEFCSMHRFFVRKKFQENLCLKVKLFILWILTVSKKGFLGIFKWWKGDKNKNLFALARRF